MGDDFGIVRLNSDGSKDTNFTALIYSDYEDYVPIQAIAVQPDGKVLVAGYILTHQSATNWNYGIARLNSDGSVDTNFVPTMGATAYGTGYSLALQPDGKVLVGGQFSLNPGTNRSVFRLHSNGHIDLSFNASGAIYAVRSLALQADGNVLIAGELTNSGPATGIARLNANGTSDGAFNALTALNGSLTPVEVVALQADGKVLIGGNFNSVNGTNRNRIARLNASGGLDMSFDPGTGANGIVRSIVVQANGRILAGGAFNIFDGTPSKKIARLNTDGTIDGGFNPGGGLDGAPVSLVVQPDGKVLVGGVLTFYQSNPRFWGSRFP